MSARQQSSTSYPVHFLLVLSIDHITGATGLAPTVTISKNGGVFGAAAGAVSEIANGWYALAGNTTDRDTLGELLIHVTCAGCDPVDFKVDIVMHNPFATIAAIETDTQDIQSRIPAALVGGNIVSNVLAIDGSTTAADKLQTSADSMELGAAIAGVLSITQMTTNLTEATNNHYNGRVILWTSGPLLRQATDIVAYDGVAKMLTYTAVTEAPVAGNTFIIV